MNLARSVAAFFGALATSAQGVVGKTGGIAQLDDEAIAGTSPPPSTLGHKAFNLNDTIERLNRARRMSASSALRGGGQGGSDGADVAVQNLREVKDVANDYFKQLETLQHQYENDKDAFASSLKAMVGSAQDVALIANEAREVDPNFDSPLNHVDLVETLDGFDLDIVPPNQLAEMIQPELLGEVVENTRHLIGVLDGLDLDALNTDGRRLKGGDEHHDDMFGSDGDDTAGFDFGSSESPHQFHPRSSTNPMLRKMFNGMGGGKHGMKMPNNLRYHFNFNTASGKGQRRRRLQANAVCLPACIPGDESFWKCNCERLVEYATEITPYDLAVMYAKQYIGTDENSDNYGNFTVNITTLDLFDADDQLPEKANRISSMASAMANGDMTTDNCNTLLQEFHTAIGLDESRQLSVDEVGEAVHTDIKLDVREIVEKYDGLGQLNPFADGNEVDQEVWGFYFAYRACKLQSCTGPNSDQDHVNCNIQHLTTPYVVLYNGNDGSNPYHVAKRCRAYMDRVLQEYATEWRQAVKPNSNNPIQCNSVSYAACAVFADSFDLLYQGRNMTTHPDENPMRKSASQPVHPSSGDSALERVNFPIANTYTTDDHGVKTVTGYENAPGLERFPGSLDTFKDVWFVHDQDNYWVSCSNEFVQCAGGYQQVPSNDKYNVKCCSNTTAGSDFWKRSPDIWWTMFGDSYSCQYTLVLDSDADPQWGTNGVGQCPPPMTHDEATEFCAGYGGRLCTVEELINDCAAAVGCGYEDKQVWSTQYSFQYSTDTGCRSSQLDGTSTMAMEACDNSTSFLVGQHTSIGTVASLARVVEERGPERMPGKCCLDNPGTSALFGTDFDPDMECQQRGHWHLGISEEVCEAASGTWTRSACITLQECIAGRPTNTSAGYSASFESFATNLDISDASNEDECGNARQGLGFDKDYEFDTDVCDEFKSRMCDPFYGELDDATDHPDPTWKDITYTPIQYPDDEDLYFTALPAMPTFQVVAEDSGLSDTIKKLQIAQQAAWTGYQTSMYIGRKYNQISGNTCESIASPLFLKAICYIARTIFIVVLFLAELLSLAGWDGVSNALVVLNQQKTNWAKENYKILSGLVDGDDSKPAWLGSALDTINGNVYGQHKQVRKDLQDRHEQMVNDINNETVKVANNEGCQIIKAMGGECNPASRRRLEGEPPSSVELDVSWPAGEDLVGGDNIWEMMKTIHERVTSIHDTLETGSGVDPSAPTKRSKKAKQAKVAGLSANLFESETESEAGAATAGATEARMDKFEAHDKKQLDEKVDAIEGKIDAMEVKMNAKIDALEVTINAKIDSLEVKMDGMEVKMDAKIDALSDLIVQLVEAQKKA